MGVPKNGSDDEENLGDMLRRLEALACDGPIPEPASSPNIEDLLRLLGDRFEGCAE